MTEITVYIDVYLFLNLFINGGTIYIVSKIKGRRIKFVRLFLADILASFLGLSICLPRMNIYFALGVKFISALGVAACAFGGKNALTMVKNAFLYISVTITYSALVIWCSSAFALKNIIYINNMEIYYNLPVTFTMVLMVFMLLTYSLVARIRSITGYDSLIYDCFIELHGRKVGIQGFLDTGNSLCDIITGLPVIIIAKSAAASIIPDIDNFLLLKSVSERYKIIPYKTADGHKSILPAFKPDRVFLNDNEIDVIVAVSNDNFGIKQGFNCLLNRYCIK